MAYSEDIYIVFVTSSNRDEDMDLIYFKGYVNKNWQEDFCMPTRLFIRILANNLLRFIKNSKMKHFLNVYPFNYKLTIMNEEHKMCQKLDNKIY